MLVRSNFAAICLMILGAFSTARAQSFSVEGDASAYLLRGYSLAIRQSFANGLELALGGGAFAFPEFLLESQQADQPSLRWTARCHGIQVARAGFRWTQPHQNGFSTHLIAMNQLWEIGSRTLEKSTSFQVLATGISGGYTFHFWNSLYAYPIASFTWNRIHTGTARVQGYSYQVPLFALSGSAHLGYEF